ncbi:alpha/beta fold hydrolase [Kineosporia succinea]|uniref:Pimeloyl-ACP methyl ester carboxylesterase n=1 Tax=Kineosporia succinea TaxID=84632 RepID=A0ABT9P498_9ACTN|nr:alpha/beta hydrolase [Kineosporia succinea]MDP9827297.1 pimeloyl-ACP methyl ester carboxylesterase [Kineosporia succinea]
MTAVALPGSFCSPAVFDRLGEHIELATYSWLTEPGPWDIPSMAAALAGHLTGPTVVIGHSTGGAIALQLAIHHPQTVSHLVLVDTGAHMRDHGDVEAILGQLRQEMPRQLLEAVLDRSFHAPLEPHLREAWLAWAAATDPKAAHDALMSQHELDFRPHLHRIAAKTLVVHGEYDQARPIRHAQELADGIPSTRLLLLPTGHTPVHEAPEQVATAIRGLLD